MRTISMICTILDWGSNDLSIMKVSAGSVKIQLKVATFEVKEIMQEMTANNRSKIIFENEQKTTPIVHFRYRYVLYLLWRPQFYLVMLMFIFTVLKNKTLPKKSEKFCLSNEWADQKQHWNKFRTRSSHWFAGKRYAKENCCFFSWNYSPF